MEESAFEQIAKRLRERAMAACRSFGTDAMDADDIAQDVMLKLWAMRKDLDKYHSLDALATLMAKHLTLNAKRKRKATATEEAFCKIPTGSASPSERLENKENEEWLRRKMEALPTTQHTILYMRQVERRDNKEIARLLGIEETSVSTLLARARRTLMEELRKRQLKDEHPKKK